MCYCPLHFVRAVCEHAKDTNKESQINIHYTTTAKLKQTKKQKNKKSNNKTLSWRLASFQLLCLLFRILFHLLSLLSHNATRPRNLRAADDTRCILAASGSVFYFFMMEPWVFYWSHKLKRIDFWWVRCRCHNFPCYIWIFIVMVLDTWSFFSKKWTFWTIWSWVSLY